MRNYRVSITDYHEAEVIVAAENRQDAEDIARENWINNAYEQQTSNDLSVDAELIQPKENVITVLVVPVGKAPDVERIDNDLRGMQKVVGGYIEVYPLEGDIALVCNEEGKVDGAPLNRAIYDGQHQIKDIIAGDFFLCNAPQDGDEFESMSAEQCEKYRQIFKYPERFYESENGLKAVGIRPKEKDASR